MDENAFVLRFSVKIPMFKERASVSCLDLTVESVIVIILLKRSSFLNVANFLPRSMDNKRCNVGEISKDD